MRVQCDKIVFTHLLRDNDDLSHGIEMLTIKSTKQKEESIVAASPEDSDEADEDDFALIKNQKGKMMQELLQW